MTVEEWADKIMKKYYLKHYYPSCPWYIGVTTGKLRNSVPEGTASVRIETHYFDKDGNELHLEGD